MCWLRIAKVIAACGSCSLGYFFLLVSSLRNSLWTFSFYFALEKGGRNWFIFETKKFVVLYKEP